VYSVCVQWKGASHNFLPIFDTIKWHAEKSQVYQQSPNCASIHMYICVCVCVCYCASVCRCHFRPFLRILLQLFAAPETMEVLRVRLATVQGDQVIRTNRA